MARRADAPHDLLFGLLALQNGMIDQARLVAAFGAWTLAKDRPMAEVLVSQGGLSPSRRTLLEALVAEHLAIHGGDPELSLAALQAGRSTRESLARLGDPEIEASLAHIGLVATENGDADETVNYSVGSSTADGQRFRILRPHARGGLGAVFVAIDTELHREVALKQILDQHADDPVSRHRFLLEAEITGGLEHPGVVPVYGLGTYDGGRPYYAMRFVKGDSLKDAITAFHKDVSLKHDPGQRSLALRKLLRRFVDVCNAIEYAHSRGVLHRDIKPSNVIVGKHGETLVVDWGLAKAVGKPDPGALVDERTLVPSSSSGSAETLPGSALGTPAYMSPEQARGDLEALSHRSDVYSLGATLYCLLTGKPPFEGEDPGAVLRQVQAGEFPPPRTSDPSIDRGLEAVCLKAMATKPIDRYPSPRVLADDVERWMADEPVTAWREPFSRRARRWARRNRTAMIAMAAAVLVALAGTAVVLGVQTRANARLLEANARVTRANVDLNAANDRERQKFDLAVEAIRRYHTGVSEDFLLKQDQFKDFRDRLLQDARDFYRKLEGLLSDSTDTRSRRALARAYEEVGELTDKVGSIPEALESHRRSLELRRELAREPSAEVEVKAEVGRSLIAISLLLCKTGQHVEALATLEEARSVLGGLVAPGPAGDAIQGQIARSYYWTGWTNHVAGKTRDAPAAYEQGREIGARLTASHPDSVDDLRILSWCTNDIAILQSTEGKWPEALANIEASLLIKKKVADGQPGVAEFRRDLAQGLTLIGIVLGFMGNTERALDSHRAGLDILRSLSETYPAVSQLQGDLANGIIETGDVLRRGGRTAEAQASYLEALEIYRKLMTKNETVIEYKQRQIQALKGLGAVQFTDRKPGEAVATWRKAIAIGEELDSSYNEHLYYLAGCHAFLGAAAREPGAGLTAEEGAAELDRAMDTLRRAVTAGFRSVAWMRRDPDLDPLRSRPDFQLLLLDLSFPVAPFSR